MISLSQQMELNHYSRKAEFAQNLMSTICGEHRLDTIYKDNLDFHYDGMRLPNKNGNRHNQLWCKRRYQHLKFKSL